MTFLIIAGLPCLALILSLLSRHCCGPFWLGANSDPSYLYFMNSLYLADHKIPTFFQHPGTPLEILGAVVIKALSFPAQGQAMVEEAIKRPEIYLTGMWALLILFYITTMAPLGWYAFQKTKDGLFVFLLQSPLFLYLTMYKASGEFLPVLANVCAETLLIGFLNIYVLCLLRAFFIEGGGQAIFLTAAGWGLVCGLMMAAKVTCLPLMLMPMVVLNSFKARMAFGAMMALGFLTATIPIWPQFQSAFNYLALMMTHTNYLGNGSAGFIAWPVYLGAIVDVFKWQWVLMTSAAFALVFVSARFLGRPSDGAKARWYAACIALTIVLHFLMVAKEPQNHYMVPAMGLFGVLWAFVYRGGLAGPRVLTGAVIAFALISIVIGMTYLGNFYASSRDMLGFSKEVYGRFDQCVICGYYRSSSQVFALQFGDDNAGRKAYGDTIQKLYRQHYFMGILEKRFDDSKGLVYGEDLLAQSPCVLLYGKTNEMKNYDAPLLHLKLIEERGNEGLFRVLQARDKEARKLLYLAQLAMLQGHGQIAYMLGYQAQALGLPAAKDYFASMNNMIRRSELK